MSNTDSNILENEVDSSQNVLSEEILDKLESIQAHKNSQETIHPEKKSTLYISKRIQYDDMKSTAYTFLFVGILGIAALVFIALGLIPLAIAGYIKALLYVIMGILFILFIIVGVSSAKAMKKLSNEADEEEKTSLEILEWFLTSFLSADIEDFVKTFSSLSEDEIYFKRYEFIQSKINDKFPDISSDYQEYMIEQIYTKLFP